MKMKAITVWGENDLTMHEVELRNLKNDEILIKVAYAGVCATDLAIYSGESSFVKAGLIKYPCRIGHEWSGIVEKVGPAVKDFKKGDRVITDNGVSCGECTNCLAGDYGNCINSKSVGTINCWEGCFAEYMYMPERHTYHLADNVSLEDAALAEPLSISLAGIKKYPVSRDTTIAIIGTGAIGIGAAAIASRMGAVKVIMVGRKKSKLDVALKCGATDVVNTNNGDVVEQVKALTDGKGVDFVLETSGGGETVMQSIDMVRKKGSVALVAFYEKDINGFAIDRLVEKQVNVMGVMGEFGLVPEAAKMLADGLSIHDMITHIVAFENSPELFINAKAMCAQRIKALVKF